MTATVTRRPKDSEFGGAGPIGSVAAPESATASLVPQQAGRSAIKDIAPLLVALMPFSVAIGAAAQTNGLSGPELIAGAVFLMAGASQLAAIELIGAGASSAVVVLTALAINLRFMLYSTGIARWFKGAPLRHRLAMAATLVDQNFMVCADRFSKSDGPVSERSPAWRSRYYTAASASLIVVFFSCQIVGYQLGATLPDGLGLHMAVPLAFSGLLAKMAATNSSRLTSIVAAVSVLVLVGLPAGTALPVAAVIGVAVGSVASARKKTASSETASKTGDNS